MVLHLTGEREQRDTHKLYEGPIIEQMPVLRNEGRVVVPTWYVMDRFLRAPDDVQKIWRKNDFYTSDAFAHTQAGEGKVIVDCADLEQALTLENRARFNGEGGLVLPSTADFENLSGSNVLNISSGRIDDVHSRSGQNFHLGCYQREPSGKIVPSNDLVEEIWHFLARGRVNVDEYAKAVGDLIHLPKFMYLHLNISRASQLPVVKPLVLAGVKAPSGTVSKLTLPYIYYGDPLNSVDYFNVVGVLPSTLKQN